MSRFVSGIFSKPPKSPPATALRVTTSMQGQPITLLLGGQQRMACNMIDYFGFSATSVPASGGGKGGAIGGGGKGQQNTFYSVSFILGVCEGPIYIIDQIWVNGTKGGFAGPNQVFSGNYTQTAWGFSVVSQPQKALNYRGIAYLASPNYPLGQSPIMPQVNVEVIALNAGNTVPGQPDGDASIAFVDFLTNINYGVGFPPARIGPLSGTPSSWSNYCKALGIGVSPVISSAVQASSFCTDLCTATNSAPCWQNGLLTVVPYGDSATQQGQTNVIAETHIVPSPFGAITIGNVGTFIADGGVSYFGGAALVPVTTFPTVVGTYYETNGTYYFNSADFNQTVVITYSYAASASYVPDTADLYDFTLDDFMQNQGTIGSGMGSSTAPVVIVRKSRDQMNNVVKVEYLDRNYDYNPVDIEFRDSASIVMFNRVRATEIKQLHMLCLASAATQSASLMLQREQIARTFQWTVGKHFMLILQLMKIVTLTYPNLGLNRQPVRIIEIQENSDESLTITAEEFPGTASAPLYGTEASAGALLNYNTDPGLVNTPLIFEPTDELGRVLISGGGLMIACGVSGVNVALWGGCQIWASYDGLQYEQVGEVVGPARMGLTSAPLPSVTLNQTGPTIDLVDTLSVDLTESAGTLNSGTQQDALAGNTKCLVGTGSGVEIISYQTATLTGASKYNLTYLVRGAYGSTIQAWPTGVAFGRIDNNIFTFFFDKTRIGATIHLKFPSFNIFKGGLQSLAAVPDYTYNITGVALSSPLPIIQNLRTVYVGGRLAATWDEITDFRGAIRTEIRQGATFNGAMTLRTIAHPPFVLPGSGTFWFTAWCQPAAGLIVRSQSPVSLTATQATLVQNVVATFDCKASGWPGTFTNGAGIDSSLNAVRTGGSGNILTQSFIITTQQVTAPTPAGGTLLTFASLPPILQNLQPGNNTAIFDTSTPSAIASGTLIQTSDGNTVTMSQGATGGGVLLNDVITFTIADILNAGGEQNGTYTPTFTVNMKRVCAATITISMLGTGAPVGQNILASNNILAMQDVLGSASSQFVDVFPMVNVSQDGVNFTPQKYSPGDYLGQYFTFTFDLTTIDANTIAYLLSAVITVQAPNRTDNVMANGTLASTGLNITFTPDGTTTPAAFNGGPNGASLPLVVVSWGDQQSGDVLQVSNLSLSGCTILIANGGVGVTRNLVNITVSGF